MSLRRQTMLSIGTTRILIKSTKRCRGAARRPGRVESQLFQFESPPQEQNQRRWGDWFKSESNRFPNIKWRQARQSWLNFHGRYSLWDQIQKYSQSCSVCSSKFESLCSIFSNAEVLTYKTTPSVCRLKMKHWGQTIGWPKIEGLSLT